ncbi:hypothetical protein DFH06DRAFT_1128768 [Mycena polygramma]|nr:hypothetical protein DFH06DRAFT_1128768 [Mycena polygramma]
MYLSDSDRHICLGSADVEIPPHRLSLPKRAINGQDAARPWPEEPVKRSKYSYVAESKFVPFGPLLQALQWRIQYDFFLRTEWIISPLTIQVSRLFFAQLDDISLSDRSRHTIQFGEVEISSFFSAAHILILVLPYCADIITVLSFFRPFIYESSEDVPRRRLRTNFTCLPHGAIQLMHAEPRLDDSALRNNIHHFSGVQPPRHKFKPDQTAASLSPKACGLADSYEPAPRSPEPSGRRPAMGNLDTMTTYIAASQIRVSESLSSSCWESWIC